VVGKTAKKVPYLRRIPVLKLLVLGEIAILAHAHLTKLEANERRRLYELIRLGHGRAGNLSESQRRELSALIAKAEPRLFAGAAVDKLSPVSIPGRLLYGPKPKRARKRQR
jgi:hypothetical protein